MLLVSDYYKQIFGQKIYKISLDAGCTCPNRDGTLSTGGCIFCSTSGSGDFAANKTLSISEQIEQAKKLVIAKMPKKNQENPKFIAYFQNFTNTYGNPEQLYAKWLEAISNPNIAGLALGTRPDCLSEEILQKLSQIADKTFLQVELGLQTSDSQTAEFINRQYKNEVYIQAVENLHKISSKIHVVTHIIFGLPKPAMDFTKGTNPTCNLQLESTEQMLQSVDFAIKNKTDGIKITVLYVLQNTKLAQYYTQGVFQVLEMEEYFELINQVIKLMPENMVVHRLTGDPPKSQLIAPTWTTDKKRVLNCLNKLIQK